MNKIRFLWEEVLASFWFLPVVIIGFSVLLSVALVSLDNSVEVSQSDWLRFFLVNSSDSARSILSTISGAMIGVAGTVFSVTLVALTLASSQFGPRLIKKFMYVRLNQVVLGSYIATYLYCLLVLNAIRDSDDYRFIPSISILVAIIVTIINIVLLIVFIHQIAVSIQADRVVSDISDFISRQVEQLFPDKIGEDTEQEMLLAAEQASAALAAYPIKRAIHSPKSGYLQYVDRGGLLAMLAQHNAILELHCRPGSFLIKGAEIGQLHSSNVLNGAALAKLANLFVIGQIKTSQQDLEFSIHQMVEIAARALSPGVNDPFTAIACVDNLSATMSYLAEAKFPSPYIFDEAAKLRVLANTLDFEGALDAAFNQIRQYSAGTPAVLIRLVEALQSIEYFTKRERHQKAVHKHLEMVVALAKESIAEKNDLADLAKRVPSYF